MSAPLIALFLSLSAPAATGPLGAFLAAPAAQRAAKIVETGVAVVSIETDAASGTGVVFLLDGKARVLTASHVLEGAKAAQVTGAATEMKAVAAHVEADLPSDDLAVLALDDGSIDAASLAAIAQASLRICTAGATCTAQPATAPGAAETIVSSSNGTVTLVRPQNRYELARKVPDEYVSGCYPYVWNIGAYTRSGVSGGAYYRAGVFAGLVTKVSRGLQSMTLAIPAEGIAAALRAGRPTGQWLPENHLEVHDGSDVIVQAFREGGDIGNGGDDRHAPPGSEPRAWHLLLTGCFYCMDDIKRLIENPFLGAASAAPLVVDGKPVAAFAGKALQAASLARYRYLRAQNASFQLLPPGAPALAQLSARRAARPFDMRFFQVFKKEPGNVLENARPMEGNFHDGVTVLLIEGLFQTLGEDMISPYPVINGSKRNAWIDFDYPDFRLHFRVAQDLSRVDVLSAGTQGAVTLPARPLGNPVKTLYGGNGLRALFLYDESDLTRAQSFILETRDNVYQLNFCHPNVGCGI
jgi:hypothetical protein